jgi:hypothetical protein
MPLYRVTFTEDGGYRCACRIRAARGADQIALAVKKIWGAACYWAWLPDSDSEGRMYERVGEEAGPQDVPRTGCVTVQVTPGRRRPRIE